MIRLLVRLLSLLVYGCTSHTDVQLPNTPPAAMRPVDVGTTVTLPANSPAAAPPVGISRTVLGGAQSKLYFATALHADCTATGRIAARVSAAPVHGSITFQSTTGYTNYVPESQLYACNGAQSPGSAAFYLPDQGFAGMDTASVEYRYPNGVAQTVTFTITVK